MITGDVTSAGTHDDCDQVPETVLSIRNSAVSHAAPMCVQGIPCWGERLANLQKIFVESFKRASPDFQSKHGYAIDEPNQANLNICAHAVSGSALDLCDLT